MEKKVYAALLSVLQYLEAEQVELQGKVVGLCLPVLREYLAGQRSSSLVRLYWLWEEGQTVRCKFPLGQIMVTEGAAEVSRTADYSLVALLARHASGDWGECVASERNHDYQSGWPLFSSYAVQAEQKIWIITEGHRSTTLLLLLPQEFDLLYASGELSLLPDFRQNNGAM